MAIMPTDKDLTLMLMTFMQKFSTLYQSRLIPYQQDKQRRASDDRMG